MCLKVYMGVYSECASKHYESCFSSIQSRRPGVYHRVQLGGSLWACTDLHFGTYRGVCSIEWCELWCKWTNNSNNSLQWLYSKVHIISGILDVRIKIPHQAVSWLEKTNILTLPNAVQDIYLLRAFRCGLWISVRYSNSQESMLHRDISSYTTCNSSRWGCWDCDSQQLNGWHYEVLVMGVLNINNQYNIYWTKYNCLSIMSFSFCFFRKLTLVLALCKSFQNKSHPTTVSTIDNDFPVSSNDHSSENPSNGNLQVIRYPCTRLPIFTLWQKRKTTHYRWFKWCTSNRQWTLLTNLTCCCSVNLAGYGDVQACEANSSGCMRELILNK
jgi:hypothetical protein